MNIKTLTGNKRWENLFVIVPVTLLLLVLAVLLRSSMEPSAQKEKTTVTAETHKGSVAEYDSLINLSLVYMEKKEAAQALSLLKKAVVINPKGATAYNNMGVACIMLQQYPEAIDYCKQAVALDPDFALARNNLQWALDEARSKGINDTAGSVKPH